MGATAEELRADLGRQRQELSRDLEAIGDRVSPGRMMERRRASVRRRITVARETVMGTSDHAKERASDVTHRMGETISHAPEAGRHAVEVTGYQMGIVLRPPLWLRSGRMGVL